MQKLDEEFLASGGEWQLFNLKQLFGSATRGRRLKSADRVTGDLPFVTAGETDMGISDFIGNSIEVFSANTVTIDMFGSAKYRNYDYGADDHVAVVHTQDLDKNAVVFIAGAINKVSNAGQFSYSRNFYAKDADELNILLPAKNGEPNYDYMMAYIKIIHQERLQALKNYLVENGFDNYILTDSEKNDIGGGREWKAFRIGGLFNIQPTKNYGLTNLDLFKTSGKVPVIVNSSINNGVGGYVDLLPTEIGNVITFSDTTTTDSIFYQPVAYIGYSHIQVMNPLNPTNWNKFACLFLVTAFKHATQGKFDYGNKFNRKNASAIEIQLPVKNNEPDYDYMATYIQAIQKKILKPVVEYTNNHLTTT